MSQGSYYAGLRGPFEVESSCALPHKSRNLRERAAIAWASIPNNAAAQVTVAYATVYGAGQSLPDDELVHGFARSKTQCESVSQNYRAEQLLVPMHHPTLYSKPMNIAFTGRSDRQLLYDQLQPVGCGQYASTTWGQ